MKFIILIAVVLLVVWFVRNNRRDDAAGGPAPRGPAPGGTGKPQDMVQCPVCSVHLPRLDALAGPDGRLYCCSEHRQRGG